MRSLRWLMPGMQVKRWLALLLAGVTVLGLGLAYGLIDWYQTVEAPEELQARMPPLQRSGWAWRAAS